MRCFIAISILYYEKFTLSIRFYEKIIFCMNRQITKVIFVRGAHTMTTWEIIEQLARENHISQKELAARIGVGQQTVSDWKHGRSNSYFKYLTQIAVLFGVSVDYLSGMDAENDEPVTSTVDLLKPDSVYDIPIYDSVSAGFGAYAENCVTGYMAMYLPTPDEAGETLFVRVRGDSMFPRISDGDLIQVHKQDYADNGNVVVMLIDGTEAVVKRYFCDTAREEVRLESYNPSYPPRVFRGREIERLHILGVARRVMSDL